MDIHGSNVFIVFWVGRKDTHRYPRLLQIQSHRQRLSHEHVRVVTGQEGPFQLLQLPTVEVGPRSSPFGAPRSVVQVVICRNKESMIEIYMALWHPTIDPNNTLTNPCTAGGHIFLLIKTYCNGNLGLHSSVRAVEDTKVDTRPKWYFEAQKSHACG